MTGRTDQQIEAAVVPLSTEIAGRRFRLQRVTVAMLTIITIIAAVGCLVTPFVPASPRAPVFVPQRAVLGSDEVRVPLSASSGGTLFANVTIGKTTAPFMIDSGCSGQILPRSMAGDKSLGALDAKVDWTDNAGHIATLSCIHAPSLIMGDVRFEDVDAVVWRDPNVPTGTLGWPAFTNVLLTIDYSDKTLILRHGELPPPDGNHILQIDNDGGNLLIPATLNGKPLRVCPDTGCEACLSLPQAQASSLKWLSPPVPAKTHNVLGDSNANVGQIDGEITIGGYAVLDPNVRVDDSQQFAIVGQQILSQFIITFDFNNMRMRFESIPKRVMALFSDLTFHRYHRTITSVDKGGLADQAGVRVGDELISISGELVDPVGSTTGPAIFDGPAVVDGRELSAGVSMTSAPGESAAASYPANNNTTSPAQHTNATQVSAVIANWNENENGPLMLELRRDGRTIHIALPLKHQVLSTPSGVAQ